MIVQLGGDPGAGLDAHLARSGARLVRKFTNLSARVIELPANAVEHLGAFGEVKFVSEDRPVRAFGGHISTTVGADAVREQTAPDGDDYTLDGTGIGIAVIDSGIDARHVSFLDREDRSRIVYARDFTGEGRTDDPYGHGTHVASGAAANGRVSNGKYIGIAPNAKLINLRVLNSQGGGSISGVLGALDWVLQYRAVYNIRVANLSLGTSAADSYRVDPLCQAVRRLSDAGVVVVAAAGNNGKDGDGVKVYGRIHSPGNEPSAITVGAANTYGTTGRGDDGVTTYSSRGPTRSSWTDEGGTRHYDDLIKPDIVAPGNKVIAAQARNNLLVRQNPSIDVAVSTDPTRKMMRLNGTSMAAPVTSGAAALILQANPSLTPNLVKAIFMYTAQSLPGANILEQGMGQINVEGAVRLAKLVRTDLTAATPVGAPLLTVPAPPAPRTSVSYYEAGRSVTSTFAWAQGIILDRTHASGTSLVTDFQRIYGVGFVLSNDASMLSSGVIASDGVIVSDGVIASDGVIVSDGVIASDSVIASDGAAGALSAVIDGDATTGEATESDSGVDSLGY